jgi:hypothetical protein
MVFEGSRYRDSLEWIKNEGFSLPFQWVFNPTKVRFPFFKRHKKGLKGENFRQTSGDGFLLLHSKMSIFSSAFRQGKKQNKPLTKSYVFVKGCKSGTP